MSSDALKNLRKRLADVDEITEAHELITGGGKGKPAAGKGRALTRAGIVLLSAAAEAFVEDLFDEAAGLIYATMTDDDLKFLLANTSRRFNNPDCFKIEVLYLSLGMTRCLQGISWQKFSNKELRISFNNLANVRGQIAHGRGGDQRLGTLKRWSTMIGNFAPRLETKVADRIAEVTGSRPKW